VTALVIFIGFASLDYVKIRAKRRICLDPFFRVFGNNVHRTLAPKASATFRPAASDGIGFDVPHGSAIATALIVQKTPLTKFSQDRPPSDLLTDHCFHFCFFNALK
jgi:hypothetical protein